MLSEQHKSSRFQFSLRSLLGLLTVASVSFATLQFGWAAVILMAAIAAFILAIMGHEEAALGIIVILVAVGIGIAGAIIVR